MHRFFIYYTFAILACSASFLAYKIIFATSQQHILLASEGGIIEMLTAIGFCVVAFVAAIIAWKEKRQIWGLFAFFMALAAARELDLHKAFTSDSVLKSNFYLKSNAPWFEKAGGAMSILVLIYAVIRLLPYAKRWVLNLWALQPAALSIFLAMGILATAKMLDAFGRLFPFLTDMYANNRPLFGLIEETLELTCVAFFLFVCIHYFMNRKKLNHDPS